MALTANYLVGKAVAVSVNGVLAYCVSGNNDRTAVGVKVTNSRSGGFQQVKAGIRGATGSLSLVYNGDDPPVGLVEGAEVALILDFVGNELTDDINNVTIVSGSPVESAPHGRLITEQILITSVKDSWNVESDYNWSIDYMSTGSYTVVETATGASSIT